MRKPDPPHMTPGRGAPAWADGTRARGAPVRERPPEAAGGGARFPGSEGGLASLTDRSRYEYQSRRSLMISPQVRQVLRRIMLAGGPNGRKLPQGASRSPPRFLSIPDAGPPEMGGHGGNLGEDLVTMRQAMNLRDDGLGLLLRGQVGQFC